MKKQKLKNYLKFGILFLGIILLFNNCEKEGTTEMTFDDSVNVNAETVSFQQAKSFFEQDQQQITLLRKTNATSKTQEEPPLDVNPNWAYFEQNPIHYTDALLSIVETDINRKGNYTSQLYFIKVEGEMKNVIFTIFKEKIDGYGDILDAMVFFNKSDGTFIDAFK